MNRRKVYVAGPLFSIADQNFNTSLVNFLAQQIPEADFILPHNYAREISGEREFFQLMFNYCIDSIDSADAILCILDGPDVDSGTAIEMGYAFARNKPIVGFRSDFRASEDNGVNLMVAKVCSEMLWLPANRTESAEFVSMIAVALKRILK